MKVKVAQSCPTLWDPMNCTVHGILQARILEWVAFPFSRGSSQPRDWTQVSCIAGGFFTSWDTRKARHTLSEGLYGYVKCSSPLWWKGHLSWVLVLEVPVGLHRTIQLQLLQHYWLGHRLRLLWYWMACLEKNRDHSVIFEMASKYCTQTLLLTMMATPFLPGDSCPQ